ncbi:MAG TPA: hypothetical protein VHT71_21755, partial [Methylomirabilota bacterium]|nr:hypothetical protein [Methylomirabilota bacterium]
YGARPGIAALAPTLRVFTLALGIGALVRTVSFWSLAIVAAIGPMVGNLSTVLHALYFTALSYSAREAR